LNYTDLGRRGNQDSPEVRSTQNLALYRKEKQSKTFLGSSEDDDPKKAKFIDELLRKRNAKIST
jgi:hypothetical protein